MSAHVFRYEPQAARIADFQRRLASGRRLPAAIDRDSRLGIAPAHLERLAGVMTDFDWPGFAARVNEHAAFVMSQGAQQLHFVHVRSAAPDALPLLLLHGWPGSFLEFRGIITELARPAPAFHVVCPSLPGYGFSSRSLEETCNAAAIADQMATLMGELGYERFVVQGGDWGSVIGSELARRHPQRCYGLHLNLAPFSPPPEGDPARAAVLPEEVPWLTQNTRLFRDGMGYYAIQSTRPQTLAVALGDSPLGLLAWLAEKYLAWSDRDAAGASLVSDAAIADQVALYWMTDSIGSSVRLYYDYVHEPPSQQRIEVPTGVAVFPRELVKNPRAWVAHRCNLVHWSLPARGGHFAALEVPQLLLADLRRFVAGLAPARS
jgi:pimeloyl-ACP methyl ester carboxylesterase